MSEEQTAPTTTTESASTEATTTTDPTAEQQTEVQAAKRTYVNGKYDSDDKLEEGYTNLASKFGAFVGAPDEYSIAEGTELNNEHPLLESIQSFGKENNLSNEGYQKLIGVLLENEKANLAEQQAQTEQVMKDLGPNATERVKNIDDFVSANLELNDDTKGLIDLAKQQPGGVELLEAFIGMSKKTGPASEEVAAPLKSYSKDELHKLQFAKDDYGNRKMNDPSYKKMVDEYTAKLLAQG